MKKIAIVSLVFLSAILFVSCNKSGVYKPKDKLAKVWYEREAVTTIDSVDHPSSTPKYLREDWIWNRDTLKSRTVYRTNGDIWYNYIYEYNKKENNRIIGITSSIASERKTRIRFIYDDDSRKIKEIKYFTEAFSENSLPHRWLVFEYDGNKVISIKETINTQRYPRSYSYMETSLLPYLVSEEMAESIMENEMRSKVEYDIKTNEYEFEWEKKNITQVKIKTTIGENVTEANIYYTYDKDRNPQLARVMGFVEEGGVNPLICSHNNVVSCTYESPSLSYTENSEYTYEKKTPVEKIVTRTENTHFSVSRITEKWTYEYAE
jgi:hypothetical protein